MCIRDRIIGAQSVIDMKYQGDMLNPETAYYQREMRKGLDWFRANNAEAYMILLD